MEATPNPVKYDDPRPDEEAKLLRVAKAWLADPQFYGVTVATDGTPLYCPDHVLYVGYHGVFPCRECG